MEGLVTVGGVKVTKSGASVSGDAILDNSNGSDAGAKKAGQDIIRVRNIHQWASRGAYKLLRALDVFEINPAGRVCVDIGASTGGFTDVLLTRGASHVYAVDVGHGQLLWPLATDSRVTVMDRTNARNLTQKDFGEQASQISLVTCDASFISLKLILPAVGDILAASALESEAVMLIKPQFEAGRENISKGGVVRDSTVHVSVLRGILDFLQENQESLKLRVAGLTHSPLLGPSGNIEFLCWLKASTGDSGEFDCDIHEIVEQAHQILSSK